MMISSIAFNIRYKNIEKSYNIYWKLLKVFYLRVVMRSFANSPIRAKSTYI